jgi:hypothetical protein
VSAEAKVVLHAGRCRAEIHLLLSGRWAGYVHLPSDTGCGAFDHYSASDPQEVAAQIRAAYPRVRIAPVCDECLSGAAARGQNVAKEFN